MVNVMIIIVIVAILFCTSFSSSSVEAKNPLEVFSETIRWNAEAGLSATTLLEEEEKDATLLSTSSAAAADVTSPDSISFQDGFHRCGYLASSTDQLRRRGGRGRRQANSNSNNNSTTTDASSSNSASATQPAGSDDRCRMCQWMVKRARRNINPQFRRKHGTPFRYIYASIDGTLTDYCEDNGAPSDDLSGCCKLAKAMIKASKGRIARGIRRHHRSQTICYRVGYCTINEEAEERKRARRAARQAKRDARRALAQRIANNGAVPGEK